MLLIGAWAEGLEAEFFESRVESLIQSAIYIYIPSTLEILSQTKGESFEKSFVRCCLDAGDIAAGSFRDNRARLDAGKRRRPSLKS